MKTLIKNGRVIDPSQNIDAIMDLLVEDGVIKEVAAEDRKSTRLNSSH